MFFGFFLMINVQEDPWNSKSIEYGLIVETLTNYEILEEN